MDADCPRLLFFTSEIPQTRNAGSMQLYRALQGYPGDRLRILGPALAEGAEGLPCDYRTRRLLVFRLVHTRFRAWVTGLNALDVFPEVGLSSTLEAARGFNPDLVVTVMDNFSYYKHAWKLARRLGAGLVTISMDDPETFESPHPRLKGAFEKTIARIYQSTALSLGVSNEMCEHVESRYGRKTVPFYFGPQDGLTPRPREESRTLRDPKHLTLAYAGSMLLGYREGIISLLPALEAADARLIVYSHQKNLVEHRCVINRGFLSPEALWPTIQKESDVVLLPYTYEGAMLKVYRTHFPTKISEYCWTGMPMLFSGPDFSTGVRWGAAHPEAALVVTNPEPGLVSGILGRLRMDGDLRVRLAAGAAAVARGQFDPAAARSRFAELMRQARDSHRAAHGA